MTATITVAPPAQPAPTNDPAQLRRFLALHEILMGFSDCIDGARLQAGLMWAKSGDTQWHRADLISLFASPWQAAEDEAGWKGDARAEGEKDLAEVTAAALAAAPAVEVGATLRHHDGRTGTFVCSEEDGRYRVQSLKGKGFWVFHPDACEQIKILPAAPADGTQPVAYLHTHPRHLRSLSFGTLGDGDKSAGWIEQALVFAAPSADKLREFGRLFKALRDESWDLRCFSVPTGGDDADIGWRVIGHWQAEPRERTIAEVFSDDPAEAVRQALAALKAEARYDPR